jgi:hypothetical protein
MNEILMSQLLDTFCPRDCIQQKAKNPRPISNPHRNPIK